MRDTGLQCGFKVRFIGIEHGHGKVYLRADHLHSALGFLEQMGAQAFVASDQGIQGLLQRIDIQRPPQTQCTGHVIRRAGRVQLPQKPLALLGIGQCQRLLARHADHRRRGVGLHVRARHGKRFQRRLFEQDAQRDFPLEVVTHPRDHLGGQQGVAATFEKVVIQPHRLDLQHRLPDGRQLLLQRGLRGTVGLGRLAQVRGRQRAAVEFAAGVQGQRIEHHPVRGHHVVRQGALQGRRQGLGIQRLLQGRYDVGHQLRTGRARLGDHGRLTYLRQALQMGFDLAHFDTETTHFDLMVDTPHILQGARRVVAGQVATAVEPRTRRAGKRVGQEAFSGQRRAVEVPLGQAGFGADAQLADAFAVQQVEGTVEHIQPTAFDGAANRYAKRFAGIRQLAGVHAGHHGGLGRPVGVDQAHSAQPSGVPGAQPFHRHRLAPHMHLAQVAQRSAIHGALLGQQVPVGRWQVGQGHALLDDFPCQLPGVPQLVTAHDQRRAHAQRWVTLLDKAVEAERGELQHTVIATQLAIAGGAVAELAESGMVDGHALGLAGGT